MPDRDFAGSRVLVLGNGNRAAQARTLLSSAGAELKQRFDTAVTFVVVDRTVPSGHHEVSRAVAASIPVLTTGQLRERMGVTENKTTAFPAVPPRPPVPGPPPVRPVAPVPVPPPPATIPAAYRPPAPSSSPHWVSARQRATAWGLGAGGLVLGTAGFAAAPVIGYAAWRQNATNQWPLVAGYAASAGLVVTGLSVGFPLALLSVVLLAVNMVVGAVHAFHVTEKLVRRIEHENVPNLSETRNRMAIAQVDSRRRLREESRKIAVEDPVKARELRIGRPDLRRAYDDGGLIDVNGAPAAYLMTIPGMTREVAEQIIDWRRDNGPFHSTSEVMVHTNLTPKAAQQIDGFALYLE